MDEEENIKVDLKQYKGHHRKFPWAFLFRILALVVSVAMIYIIVQQVQETMAERAQKKNNDTFQIEVELE